MISHLARLVNSARLTQLIMPAKYRKNSVKLLIFPLETKPERQPFAPAKVPQRSMVLTRAPEFPTGTTGHLSTGPGLDSVSPALSKKCRAMKFSRPGAVADGPRLAGRSRPALPDRKALNERPAFSALIIGR